MLSITNVRESFIIGGMTVAKRIRQARIESGKTQQWVADLFNISRAAVAQWESDGDDNTVPESGKLSVLAKSLDVTCDWLLTGEGIKQRAYLHPSKAIESTVTAMLSMEPEKQYLVARLADQVLKPADEIKKK